MKTYQITENIRLELSHPLHATELHRAVRKNKTHLQQYLTWVPLMKTIENYEDYLTKCANDRNEGKEWSYNIFKDNRIIGRIDLHQIDQTNQNAAIGYWLAKKEVGNGIITKAAKRLIDYAFNDLHLNRIEILTATHNIKSTAIALRLGFQHEGVLREMEKHNDIFYDLNIFSMLKKEWEEK